VIGRVRESRNPKKVIRVTLMESYGEIGRVPVNLLKTFMFVKTPMDRNSLSRPQLYYTRSGIVFPGKGQELPQ